MRVTLAKRQPRPSDIRRCDDCLGKALENDDEVAFERIHPSKDVKTYNVLVPGAGTHTFDMCPPCVEALRNDS